MHRHSESCSRGDSSTVQSSIANETLAPGELRGTSLLPQHKFTHAASHPFPVVKTPYLHGCTSLGY